MPETKQEIHKLLRRRWSTRGHLVVRLCLLIVVFLQINYIGCRSYKTLDWSRNQKFSLSDRTVGLIEQLGDRVQIITVFLGTSDVLPDVKGIVGEYDRIGGKRISAEFLDLSRSGNRIAELRDLYKLSLNSDQVVVISDSGRVKRLSGDELVYRDAASGRILEFRGEEKLTSAILEVTEAEQKKVYLIYGGRRGDEILPISQQLESMVKSQNARLEVLDLKGRQSIPTDADALVFAGNTSDLTLAEVAMVRSFWEERQGGLMILLDPAADTPKLVAFLQDNGVYPNPDRILLAGGISGMTFQKTYEVPATILPGDGPTRDLPVLNLVLNDRSQSLSVLGKDELMFSQNIRPRPLIMADQRYWGETEFESKQPVYDRDVDNGYPNPVYVAASVEKGKPNDLTFAEGSSRMVVVGNPNLISPQGESVTQKNAADFCMASLNWIMNRDQLLGISPKKPTNYHMFMRSATFGLLQTLVIWLIPSMLLFSGALIWYKRRA